MTGSPSEMIVYSPHQTLDCESYIFFCMELFFFSSHLYILLSHTSCFSSLTTLCHSPHSSLSLYVQPLLLFFLSLPPPLPFSTLQKSGDTATACVSQLCKPLPASESFDWRLPYPAESQLFVCICVSVWVYADGRASESGKTASHLSAVITLLHSPSSPPLLPWSSSRLNHNDICKKGW